MAATEPIRVALAEDDYLVRKGAVAVLSGVDGIEVVGACGNPAALLDLVTEHDPDVVVLDIRMPPSFTTEGIDLATRLRAERPGLGVVILSQHADPEYALELLEDDPSGVAYLLKERLGDVDQLVHAIRTVVGDGAALDPRIVRGLIDAQQRREDPRLAALTPREREVLALMAAGMANASVAVELDISERSVEKHNNAIFAKLGLSETTDLNRRVAAVVFYLQRRGAGSEGS